MPDLAIEVYNLTKSFAGVTAVKGVSFVVERGATCALLGPNGAGKTTTLALLQGLIAPTSGRITVLGYDLRKDRYRALARMNFFSPYLDLPQRLTVYENLSVYGRLYGIRFVRRRIAELAEDLDIGRLMRKEYRSLSAGQKMRVVFAKAMLNLPELLLLDEPTASLDPDTAERMRQFVLRYQRTTGATILMVSHNMEEVQRISTGVLVMRAGEIIDHGTPLSLLEKYGRDSLEEVFIDVVRDGDVLTGPRRVTPARWPTQAEEC